MMNTLLRRACFKKYKFLRNFIDGTAYSKVDFSEKLQAIVKRVYSSSQSSHKKQIYLIDEDESKCVNKISNFSKYTSRSYTCGELRSSNIGERDMETQKSLSTIPYESIIQVKGTVLSRPKDMMNEKQATGQVEVLVNDFKIVNKARDNLPFNIREFQKAKESLRIQYRYLDLRFPQMQRNLRERSMLLMKMREYLVNNNFVDVETPTLFKATPGGAQEFIVPTRFPGQFYSLVQSPQQFKQMLMAGAMDKYFQIARCYRDEGVRSDRQPEFTQLDIEMSFTNMDGVMCLIEDLLSHSWPDYLNPIPVRFQRMSFEQAVQNYGNDKPDIRFDFTIENCTDLLRKNKKLVNSDNFQACFVKFPKEYSNLSKQIKSLMSDVANKFPRVKFVQSKINTTKEWIHKISKLLGSDIAIKFTEENKIQDESVLFLAYGNKNEVLSLLGKVRLEYVNFLENLGITIRKKGMHFLWVTDFPLFEVSEETGCLQSAHHPFTAPHLDDLHLLKTEPLKVRALAYDLVLNGNEVGGGSIRIHDPALQETVLDLLKIKKDTMQHILDMLSSGCPPHGGIALGLDRLLSILLNTTSIRDVIAFPKNFEGRDPLSGAPSYISEQDQKLYHIKSVISDKDKK
ncbi:aspartate--tRNA ligase, mitochondrial isoform X2 [Anoplophora glabripennis]|uniref:aspartate--tRNA ligase, mitochondrial isoform X2 n=1 Tax=Anoplophora glabripennis TaxID=217634 RepID=UPI000874B114|nr:aspartate--tRNA ligase, mitochondrial isoform X2 [Anoplophora glabripennis]